MSEKNSPLDVVKDHHNELAADPRPWRKDGWRTPQGQRVRHAFCLSALKAPKSILDFGCGGGALVDRLKEHRFSGEYLGVDLLPSAVARAREDHPQHHFLQGDHSVIPARPFDLTIACGTFSLSMPDYLANTRHTLETLWSTTTNALVLIVLSRNARAHLASTEDFYLHSPGTLANLCRGLTPHIVLREDLLPTDLCAILYRRPPLFDVLKGNLDADAMKWWQSTWS